MTLGFLDGATGWIVKWSTKVRRGGGLGGAKELHCGHAWLEVPTETSHGQLDASVKFQQDFKAGITEMKHIRN